MASRSAPYSGAGTRPVPLSSEGALARNRAVLYWGLVALLTGAIVAIAYDIQIKPLYNDPAAFMVFGRGILHGQVPYVDVWDQKPFGTYLIAALAWWLNPGDPTTSMQVVSAVFVAITATATGWLVAVVQPRRWVGAVTAVIVALAFAIPHVGFGGGMTELFADAGIAVTAAAIVAMGHGRRGPVWPVVAGAGLAVALNTSNLTVAAVPALALLWLAIPYEGAPQARGWRSTLAWLRTRVVDRRVGAAAASFVVLTLLIWLPVIVTGGLASAFDAVIRYNYMYAQDGTLGQSLRALRLAVVAISPVWAPIAAIAAIPLVGGRLLGWELRRSRIAWAAVLWGIVQLLMLLAGKKFAWHSMMLFIPPIAILAGLVIAALQTERTRIDRRIAGVALAVLMAAGFAWQGVKPAFTAKQLAANNELAQYARTHSAPGDTIYVWGADPDLFLRADRTQAGPYYEIYSLRLPGYGQESTAKMLRLWESRPPRLIFTNSQYDKNDVLIYNLKGAGTSEPVLAPLQAFIRSHYVVAATLASGQVWEYRG